MNTRKIYSPTLSTFTIDRVPPFKRSFSDKRPILSNLAFPSIISRFSVFNWHKMTYLYLFYSFIHHLFENNEIFLILIHIWQRTTFELRRIFCASAINKEKHRIIKVCIDPIVDQNQLIAKKRKNFPIIASLFS